MKDFLLFLLICSYAFDVNSQVNIEDTRGEAEGGFTGRVDVGFERLSGNSSTLSYFLKSRTDYVRSYDHFFLVLEGTRGESRTEMFKDQAFAHLRWTSMWGGWVGSDLFVQSQYDSFKDLVLRQLEGGYLRLVSPLFDGQVALGLGAMSDYERLKNGKGEGFIIRGTSYLPLSESLFGKKVKVSVTGYYQPKLKVFSDYRLTAIGQLEVSIIGKLSLVPTFSYTYDSRPPTDIQVDDSETKLLLRYRW